MVLCGNRTDVAEILFVPKLGATAKSGRRRRRSRLPLLLAQRKRFKNFAGTRRAISRFFLFSPSTKKIFLRNIGYTEQEIPSNGDRHVGKYCRRKQVKGDSWTIVETVNTMRVGNYFSRQTDGVFPSMTLRFLWIFWLTQTEVKLCVVVSTWPPRNSNRSGASDGIFPSKWTISDHSFPNYKKHFDNFSILPSFVPDKLRRPRILGPARSNLTLVPEEEEEDVELEGDHESSAHSSSPSSVVGPVAYLSCEVVSLGKATQVRIIKIWQSFVHFSKKRLFWTLKNGIFLTERALLIYERKPSLPSKYICTHHTVVRNPVSGKTKI